MTNRANRGQPHRNVFVKPEPSQKKGFKPITGKLSTFTKGKKDPLPLNRIDKKAQALHSALSSKKLLTLLQSQKNGWAKWESPTVF